MKKISIVLLERDIHPKGYTLLSLPTEKDIWEKIFEVCVKENYQYLHHFVLEGWEEDESLPKYESPSGPIPCGKYTYYVEIYAQEK